MNETALRDLQHRVLVALQSRENLKGISEECFRDVIDEWVRTTPPLTDATPGNEILEVLAQRVLSRARLSAEEREVRAKLAAKLGSSLDDLDAIVHRHFEGATRDIALRHMDAVRQERTRRVLESVLQALGGPSATLESLLTGTGRAVATGVSEILGGASASELEGRLRALQGREATLTEIEELVRSLRRRSGGEPLEAAAVGQVAQAVSQAIQQVALNVQKIITVALEAERSAADEDPKYYYP